MRRLVLNWVCVLALVALPVGGCSDETGGTGGSGDTGGDGGSGGMGGGGGTDGMPECANPDDCDDGNECTDNACGAGMCEYPSVADGTACDEGNECSLSMCAEGICPPVADDTACGDDGGPCQQGSCRVACDEQGIRDAIAAGGGPYTFDCDGPQTVVTEAEIIIDNDVILDGEGNLTVDGGGEHVDRSDNHHVFLVTEGVTAELRAMTVTKGFMFGGDGGGISNQGTLTVMNSTVSGNAAPDAGGIWNDGALTVTNSTVSGNVSINGGGIWNGGTLTVTNSTVSGNRAICGEFPFDSCDCCGYFVGGIANYEGTMTVTNSAVSGNVGDPGGIGSVLGTVTLTSSLVDGDCEWSDGPPPDITSVTSNGHNVESPGDTCGFDQEGDQANVTEGGLNLGPLQDNGGPTETHALLSGSVAIDVIPADMCEVDEDQRGFPRDSMCDVGAFEVQP